MNHDTYLTDKLEQLPEYVSWAIQTTDYSTDLESIKRKYKLHIDQSSVLEKLTVDFILGEIDQAGFVESMFHDGRISYQVAGDILVDINELIIKKIRQKIEDYKEQERALKENEEFYMSEDEKEEQEQSTYYQQQDEEYVKIKKEVEEQEKQNGPLTDADLAREQGLTLAEYLAQNQASSEPTLKTAVSSMSDSELYISEKDDLLKELESPAKSFKTPLSSVVSKKPITETELPKEPIDRISPDHQLQNTHLEEPFETSEFLRSQTSAEKDAVVEIQPVSKPVPEPKPTTLAEPTIQKPTKLEIKHDIYREPIE